MSTNPPTKVAVSVAEMARMVGLSRARFYQLVEAGVFLSPQRQPGTNRPFYSEEQQQVVLDVRRRNCGVNGQAVLFYARRVPATGSVRSKPPRGKAARSKPAAKVEPHADLIAALQALGLSGMTPKDVADAAAAAYPAGTAGEDEGEIVRAVFLRLKLGLTASSGDAGRSS